MQCARRLFCKSSYPLFLLTLKAHAFLKKSLAKNFHSWYGTLSDYLAKAIKKKTPFMGGVAPPPYELLKKLDQNFFLGRGANLIIK